MIQRERWIYRPLHAKNGKESSRYEIKFPNGIEWGSKRNIPKISKREIIFTVQ